MYREPPRGSKKKTYLELHHPRGDDTLLPVLLFGQRYFGSPCSYFVTLVQLFCDSSVFPIPRSVSSWQMSTLFGPEPDCPAVQRWALVTLCYTKMLPWDLPGLALLARGGPAFLCALFTTFMRITGFHFSVKCYIPQGWNCLTCTQHSTQQRAG